MDWKVSEDTGLTQEIHLSENNISEQIRMGMAKEVLTEVSDDGESRAAYDREGLQQMREAGNTAPEVAELLQKGEVSISASNLLAAQALMDDPAEMFGNLRRYREKYRQEKEMLQTAGSEVRNRSLRIVGTAGSAEFCRGLSDHASEYGRRCGDHESGTGG